MENQTNNHLPGTYLIQRGEYCELLAAKERLECLRRLFENERFPSDSTIRAFMGWLDPALAAEVDVPDVFAKCADAVASGAEGDDEG